MSRIGRVLKSYLFWTHDRGSFHYDVMVTLILVFIFFGPRFIAFKDQPAEHLPHRTSVEITPDGNNGFICLVEASTLDGQSKDAQSKDAQSSGDARSDSAVRASLLRVIRPIA